jgi:hypothetical protein
MKKRRIELMVPLTVTFEPIGVIPELIDDMGVNPAGLSCT